jgi:hypothetical protein
MPENLFWSTNRFRQGYGGSQQSTSGIGPDFQPSAQLLKPFACTGNPDSDIRSTAIHFR